ncbi:MAG: lysylphosphatidylglycerol synthase transmembrane domain-containing protein [Bacteroidales bacterium]
MKKGIGKYINFAVFLSLAILLLYYAFRSVDFNHIVQGFRSVNYLWIFLSILAGLIAHILRAIRWGILIEPLGKKPSLPNLFSAVMVGYLANVAFPRFGEIAKCGSIRKTDGVKFESLVGTVVVERAMDLVMLLVSTLIVIAIKIDLFGGFIYDKILLPIKNKALQIEGYQLIIILIVLAAFVLLFVFIIKSGLLGHRLSEKVKSMYHGVIDGLRSVTRTHRLSQFLVLSVLIWIFYWIMTWLLIYSTPITSGLTIWDGLFIMVIGSFGMTVPVQGGFGAFHIITAIALGIFGISYDDGLVFAIVSHESQTIFLIISGLLALAYLYSKYRVKALGLSDDAQVD